MSVLHQMQEYYESPALNQSFLKKLIDVDDVEIPKLPGSQRFMEPGTVIDWIITIPPDQWKDKMLIVQAEKKPSETMETILNMVWESREAESDLNNLIPQIEQAITAVEYVGNRNWYMSQKVDKVINSIKEFWELRLEAEGKTVVLQNDFDNYMQIADNIKGSANTYKYFVDDGLVTTLETQHPVYATLEGVDCKGLLDLVSINEQTKTMLPMDLKVTNASLRNWKYTARKFRYDFQASFYTALLKAKYPEYTILPFTFIVASQNPAVTPFVYVCTELDLIAGETGIVRVKSRVTTADDTLMGLEVDEVSGWKDALDIYTNCKRLGLDNFDLESYLTNRTKRLDLWL